MARTGRQPSPACPWHCGSSSSTAWRPTGRCWGGARRGASGTGGGHPLLERRDDLRDARIPEDARRRHAVAAASSLTAERAARSLVPVRHRVGATSVGLSTPTSSTRRQRDDRGPRRWTGRTGARPPRAASACGRHGARRKGVVDLVAEDGLRGATGCGPTHEADVNGPEGQSTFALHAEDDPDERRGIAGECRAPLPGAIMKVLVAAGDAVNEGDGLVVLEAMKMEHTLRADGAGTVSESTASPGGPGRRARPPGRGAAVSGPGVLRMANCSGFFGDRAYGGPRDGRGRPDRRPHRRLAGRADDAHPPQDQGAQRRLRRPRSRASSKRCCRPVSNAGSPSSPTPAASTRRAWRPRWGSWPGDRGSRCGSPRSPGTTSRRGYPSCGPGGGVRQPRHGRGPAGGRVW